MNLIYVVPEFKVETNLQFTLGAIERERQNLKRRFNAINSQLFIVGMFYNKYDCMNANLTKNIDHFVFFHDFNHGRQLEVHSKYNDVTVITDSLSDDDKLKNEEKVKKAHNNKNVEKRKIQKNQGSPLRFILS